MLRGTPAQGLAESRVPRGSPFSLLQGSLLEPTSHTDLSSPREEERGGLGVVFTAKSGIRITELLG